VAGRHQITSGGKHLFDGATFGKPRHQGLVDRPAVEIPPRKRQKIMNEEYVCGDTVIEPLRFGDQGDVMTYDADNRQLVLRANFDDDESNDDDYELSEDDKDEDMEEDVSDPQHESSGDDGFSSEDPLLNDLPHEKMRTAAQELREAFPKAPMSVCKSVLLRCNGDLKKAWETLTHGFKPSKSREMIEEILRNHGTVLAKENTGTRGSARRKRRMISEENIDDEELDAFPNDYRDSLLKYYDQHGLPGGTISTGNAHSQMSKIVSNTSEPISKRKHKKPSTSTPRLRGSDAITKSKKSAATRDLKEVAVDEDDDSSDLDSDTSDEDSDDSSDLDSDTSDEDSGDSSDLDSDTSDEDSGDSSSESSDDSDNLGGADSTSSSGGSSSSDEGSGSDSEPDKVSSKSIDIPTEQATSSKPKDGSRDGPLPEGLSVKPQPTIPPGTGKKSTKKRNQRRRNANALRRFQEKGILPAGTTISEFEQLDMDKIGSPRDALEALLATHTENSGVNKEPKTTPKKAEFEARRQQLLAAIASGGIEVGPDSSSKRRSRNITGTPDLQMSDANLVSEDAQLKTSSKSLANADNHSAEINGIVSSLPNVSTTAVCVSGEAAESVSDPAPRFRKKLDIGAAGRLVFGALGVRTPKTKAEKEKVRNDLMKHIRPTQPASNVERIDDTVDPGSEHNDPDAWEKVINLRAVECCDEGIELSPAPFPFVQRWDPQQQGSYGQNCWRGSKGKKHQRNQAHFYEDEQRVSKKRKRNRNDLQDGSYDQYSEAQLGTSEISDYYQENEVESQRDNALRTDGLYSDGIEGDVNEQLVKDVQEAAATSKSFDNDDLPMLPENISTLSDLSAQQANTGMVIAFKHLVMSEATNWQPQISNYLTAVVIKVLEYGLIELTLAKRDRDRPEKHYDGLTGERIYGKFDMPSGDEDEEEDDGFRSLTFAELVEPKIVQNAPEILMSPKVSVVASAGASHERTNTSNDESATLGHEDSVSEPKASVKDVPQVDGSIDRVEENLVDNGNPQVIQPQSEGDGRSSNDAKDILNIKEARFQPGVPSREEILNIIKEAGFRSNIPSSVTRPQLPRTPTEVLQNGSSSPKFHSLDPSPSHIFSSPSNDETGRLTPIPAEVIQGYSNTGDVHYPWLSVASSLASQDTDHGHQPDFPSPGENTLHEFNCRDSLLGVQDDRPVMEPEFPSAQPSSVRIETQSKLPSMPPSEVDPDFPTLDEIFSTIRSSVVPKQEVLKPLEPMLDHVREAKADEEYNKAMEELDASLDAVDDADQVTPKASKSYNHTQIDLPSVSSKTKPQTKKSRIANSRITRSQFVIPPGSQQVDLTLPSDVEVGVEKENKFDELYDDSLGLPSGPGWVKKKRKIRKSTSSVRSASQPISPKSRLTRRKTTTRF
jgi:hypothetical protein